MNIMVLDDSDDDTVDVLEKTVNYYKTQGFQIEHVRRGTRKGYKAGAPVSYTHLTLPTNREV